MIASAKISTLVHATEDRRKVIVALNQVCSEDKFHPRVTKQVLKGHFGNPITRIDLSLSGRAASAFFDDFWAKLPSEDRGAALAELDRRVDDEGKLHLRVDKQECFRGVPRIGDQDSMKIEIAYRDSSGSVDEVRRSLSSE